MSTPLTLFMLIKKLFSKKSTVEIERKFLVDTASYYDRWKPDGKPCTRIVQGYLNSEKERTVRVRIAGNHGFITVKGASAGISCREFEYKIPVTDAFALLEIAERSLITKDRYEELHDGKLWEIDVFHDDNEGLIVAEVELSSESEKILLPGWVGSEVSTDHRFKNVNLAKNPFKNWKNDKFKQGSI